MNGLIVGFLVGFLIYPWFGPVGVLLGGVLGFLADASGKRTSGAFGAETRELVVRLFALWGKVASHGGGVTQAQGLFLQSVLTNQLRLGGPLAREALGAFEESHRSALGSPWTEVLTDTASLSREIHDDFFLDRQTLVWIYATCRRVAALGNIRAGIVELLDTVAKTFGIFDEVGSAGTETRSDDRQYEQAWQHFRPGSVGPEAYAVLGLSPDASVDEIKKTYRTLVRQYHPDSHSHLPDGDPLKKKASERFLQVQQAYERIRQSRKF